MEKIQYACSRKKDFVTFLAVAMFLAICAFELYLIFVLPVQLGRKNAMISQVEKQKVLFLADNLRNQVWGFRTADRFQEGEVQLVGSCLDILAVYARANQETMGPEQVTELKNLLSSFANVANSWNSGYFRIGEKRFDVSPLLSQIDQKLARDSGSSASPAVKE